MKEVTIPSISIVMLLLLACPSAALAESAPRVSTQSITFNYLVGDPDPSPYVFNISSPAGAAPFSCTSDSSWLTVMQSAPTTPAELTIIVHPAGLATGTFNGLVTVSQLGVATNSISVTLVVKTFQPVDRLTLSNTALTFAAAYGDQATMTKSFRVDSSGQPLAYAVSVSSGAAWLTADATTPPTPPWQYLTPATLRVFASARGLAPGTYNGSVSVSSNHAVNSPQIVTVTLVVAAPPEVRCAPDKLTFQYQIGGQAPAAQTIQVSGNGAALPFSATASSAGNWLAISPSSGTAPATGTLPITVSLTNLEGLIPNQQYNGTIVVAGRDGAAGSTTISVTLSVGAPLPTIVTTTNAASYRSGAIAAGEIITIFGTALGPAKGVPLTPDLIVGGRLPTTLGGVQVLVNSYPAPLFYASATQISAIVPYEINSPVFLQNVTLLVKYSGQSSNVISLGQSAAAPGLFTADSSGSGPGAFLNPDMSLNSRNNPAKPGDPIVLYLTGEGQTLPYGVSGSVTSPLPPYIRPVLSPIVTIDGQPAQVLFHAEAPGIVAGLLQINVQIPAGARSGDLPVVVTFGTATSQLTAAGAGAVTVSVQQPPASPPPE